MHKNTSLDTPLVGSHQFPDYLEARDLVDGVCESIGRRVKSGVPPALAIAGELCARFPDPVQLSAVDRHLLGMLQQLATEYVRDPRDARRQPSAPSTASASVAK